VFLLQLSFSGDVESQQLCLSVCIYRPLTFFCFFFPLPFLFPALQQKTEDFETGYEGSGGTGALQSTLQTRPHVHGGDHPTQFTRGCEDGSKEQQQQQQQDGEKKIEG